MTLKCLVTCYLLHGTCCTIQKYFCYLGVGGIEAEAVMLGQPISMVLPEVIGYRLFGSPNKLITSTDIVLTVTKVTRIISSILYKLLLILLPPLNLFMFFI